MNHRVLLPLLVLFPAACVAPRNNPIPATPQRPTVSQSTRTTAYGTFEVEAGATWDPSDSFDTPVRLKYGASANTEVSIQASPLVILDLPNDTQHSGLGDVRLAIRHRLWDDSPDQPSVGVMAEVKLPTADQDKGLGSGQVDAGFAGIATHTMYDTELTGFYRIDFLSRPDATTDVAHTLAVAAQRPIPGTPFGALGEISSVFYPEGGDPIAQLLIGGTYAPYPSLVFDVDASVGLSSAAPDFVLLAGLTLNLGVWEPPARTNTPRAHLP